MQDIVEGVHRFQERREQKLELYRRLADEGQHPKTLFIGCSDSRVPPEVIADADPGVLFVTRNIANIVPPYGGGEVTVGAIVEYAIRHLHVQQIILCGHTDCGGIKALDAQPNWDREPHITRWLEHARPAKTKVQASGLPEEERHLATVRENVLLQLEHLRSYDPVRDAERAGALTLVGWVYHLDTGMVEAYDPQAGSWVAEL